MSEFTYPGVYIQEKPGVPGPIAGVSTSNLGLIGFTEKGPVDDPILVTSFPEFTQKFGSFTTAGLTPTMAYAFFQNGGATLYVVRVTASDAIDAYTDYEYALAAGNEEDLGNTVEGSGIYSLQLASPPVKPTSVTITFSHATTDNVFTDAAGDGVLSKTSGGGSGGTGFINYTTGEVSITLINPADFTGGSDKIEALYTYRVFRFQMKWPGAIGNYYRVSIQPGSSDYLTEATASWSRFTVLVDEDVDAGATGTPSWVTVETFADLVFDDPTDANYVVTVMNADSGSDLVEVVEYGNHMKPSELAGTAVVAEDFSATQEHSDDSSAVVPDYYNTKWKGWKYDLANGAFPTTFVASFKFQDGGPRMADGLTAAATAVVVGPDAFDPTLLPIATSSVRIAADLTTAGPVIIEDDGSGNLNEIGTAVKVGEINYTTGVISDPTGAIANTLDVSGGALADTFKVGSEIRWVSGTQIGTGAAGPVATATIKSPGSAAVPAKITASSVRIDATLTGDGKVVITDNGAGKLIELGTSEEVGEIDYTTGQITDPTGLINNQLDVSAGTLADTFVAGTPILMQCDYDVAVDVSDDGDGNLALASTQAAGYPQKFTLDSNGTNSITQASGNFTITWAIAGQPSDGPSSATAQTASYYTDPADDVTQQLANGTDGSAVSSSDIIGPDLAADEKGLWAFGKVDSLMQLVASDFQTDTTVADSLITYAELQKDKFVILTVPAGLTPQEAVNWKKYQLQTFTSYAALYYPHIKIVDPVTEINTDVPVGGHVGGIYARTDITKNVSKAPAGTEDGAIRWSVGLERDLTPNQVGTCNPEKINCLVQWPHTGRCVWGARSLDIAGGEWTYIQQRRLFMFLEKSVFNATHLHVFKNNGPALWSAIRTQITSFMLGLYQAGYFAGTSPQEAFFVICDRTNNLQNTVDQGIVYCDIGAATNKPAEFIVFRFQQVALASAA
jgi:phage tail sheath protein FI